MYLQPLVTSYPQENFKDSKKQVRSYKYANFVSGHTKIAFSQINNTNFVNLVRSEIWQLEQTCSDTGTTFLTIKIYSFIGKYEIQNYFSFEGTIFRCYTVSSF